MFVNNIEDAFKALKVETEKLQKKVDLIIEPKKVFNLINIQQNLNKISETNFFNKNYYGHKKIVETKNGIEKAYELIVKELDELEKQIKEQHELNIPLIEHNKKIEKKLINIMEIIGIKPTYNKSYYKTRRSIKKTIEIHQAGYKEDILREILLNDNFIYSLEQIRNKRIKIEKLKDKLLKVFLDKEKEEQKIIRIKKKENLIKNLAFKYKLEFDMTTNIDIYDVLEKLLSQNKYLALAYALEQNRSDWNNGCNYVENAIDSFKIETKEDEEIEKEINSVIGENWDGDGRIFRDINYSYDALYDLVDNKDLIKDFYLIKEYL